MRRYLPLLLIVTFLLNNYARGQGWQGFHNIEKTDAGYKTTGDDPFMESEIYSPAVSSERHYLQIEISNSSAIAIQIYWRSKDGEIGNQFCEFSVPANAKPTIYVFDLDKNGHFDGLEILRFDPGHVAGLTFDLGEVKLLALKEVPQRFLPGLIKFHCYAGKLHFRPGEPIPYKAVLNTKGYPEHRSSKILEVSLYNAAGKVVGRDMQHYGLPESYVVRELSGVIYPEKPLAAGKYYIEAVSTDQMNGLELKARHDFGITGDDDPLIYETPFKFVKDFSIIQDAEGIWHVFSITGDYIAGHDWMPDGNERTFSHGTSKDLRNWTYHKPVLSISDKKYPDGKGMYKDRNIWAPHVIGHNGKYFMFYTSVNKHVSQSISLAVSDDLFNWTEYENNPVLTLEGLDWAHWERGQWADCRDSMVLADNGKFYMYVTAYLAEGKPRGMVAVAESDDLYNWGNRQIAVRGIASMESPVVWREGEMYYMTTSAWGQGCWESKSPTQGWQSSDFKRPGVQQAEKYVETSPSYAEEIVGLADGTKVIASLTWRHWGNTIYFFEIVPDKNGKPIGYKSPFCPVTGK